MGCAPEPPTPTADLNFYPGMPRIDGLELPDGSVVRFVLHGDVIEVWVAASSEEA